jgi:hypothetical protein
MARVRRVLPYWRLGISLAHNPTNPLPLGCRCWKVERSLAWLANRRLTVRYERRPDIPTAFLHLACALIRSSCCEPALARSRRQLHHRCWHGRCQSQFVDCE